MDPKQNQLDAKLDRLIEIYKLQAQLADSISARQITINRFYQIILSGLILIFLALLQNKGTLFSEEPSELIIEQSMIIIGMLGLHLSWMWCVSADIYLEIEFPKI